MLDSSARRWPFLVIAVSAALGCGPGDMDRPRADPRPNILLISLDTTRADHISAYGYERPTSPRLDVLAAQGVIFESAYAPSATTGPTHASLFTGLYPTTLGVQKNGVVLADRFETLAERLAATGYETAAVVSSFVLSDRFGFAQGFDVYDADFSQASVPEGVTVWEGLEIEGKFYGSAEDTTRRALSWLGGRTQQERPFFLLVHYFDPHDPYTPPPGWSPPFDAGPRTALKQVRTNFLYDVLISFTDHHVGVLLDGLEERGRAGDTLVVVLGDHGEGLMDHGHPYHGAQIYEEAVRVPLIARWPGRIPPGTVVATPTALIDLMPTLLEWSQPGGESLEIAARSRAARWLGTDEDPGGEPVFLYRRHYEPDELGSIPVSGEQFGVRSGSLKLIDAPAEGRRELYDLAADPGERVDVSAERPEDVARLLALVDEWRRATRGTADESPPLSAEERARLEALGYVD